MRMETFADILSGCHAFNYQRARATAQPAYVHQNAIELCSARPIRHKVQVTQRIGLLIVCRRNHNLVPDGQGAGSDLKWPAGGQWVARHALDGAYRNAIRAVGKDLLNVSN